MTFPTDTQNIATDAARELVNIARALRRSAVDLIAECDTGTIDLANVYERFMGSQLARAKPRIALLNAIPGIHAVLTENWPNKFANEAAAQTQAGEFIAAVNAIINLLETEAPTDAQGRLLVLILDGGGTAGVTNRTLNTPGAINTLRAALVAFRDTFTT